MLLREIEIRYSARRISGAAEIAGPEDVHRFCKDMGDSTVERFAVLLLDTRNRVRGRHDVATGSLSSVETHPREVFRAAVMTGAYAVILVHNHPSGDPIPSPEDLVVTQRLVLAGQVLGIKVLDHVVIGDGVYCSIAEQGRM